MTKVHYQRLNMHVWLNSPIAKVKCIYREQEGASGKGRAR